jgi:hypothetical protein
MKSISSNGPHAEPAELAQRPVDGRRVGEPLVVDAQRLAVERPGDAVDDEPRRVGGDHGRLPPRVDERARGVGHAPARGERRHDLDERQHGRRVEEVHAEHALRTAAGPAIDAMLSDDVLLASTASSATVSSSRANSARFTAEILDHGLDHQPAAGERGEVVGAGRGREAHDGRRRVVGRHAPLLGLARERPGDAVAGARCGVGARVGEDHRMAGAQRDLGDAGAHRAGTDDTDGRRGRELEHGSGAQGWRGPSTVAPPCRSVTRTTRPASRTRVSRIAGSNEAPKVSSPR